MPSSGTRASGEIVFEFDFRFKLEFKCEGPLIENEKANIERGKRE